MSQERIDPHREQLLKDCGLSPQVARNYLQERFEVTPEEIREACPNGHGNHEIEAFVRIALGGDEIYLLEDVYQQVRDEVEEQERRAKVAAGLTYWNPINLTEWRTEEFRHTSREIRDKHEGSSI